MLMELYQPSFVIVLIVLIYLALPPLHRGAQHAPPIGRPAVSLFLLTFDVSPKQVDLF